MGQKLLLIDQYIFVVRQFTVMLPSLHINTHRIKITTFFIIEILNLRTTFLWYMLSNQTDILFSVNFEC